MNAKSGNGEMQRNEKGFDGKKKNEMKNERLRGRVEGDRMAGIQKRLTE